VRIPNCSHAALVLACLAIGASPAASQTFEVTPFGGYRFGGDFFELLTNQPVDLDGAPAVGVAVNVPLESWGSGLQFEALFTHQQANVTIPATPFGTSTRVRITVEHWQAGGLQEFGYGRARPFLTGLLGLTHYAAEDDNEIRFSVSAGGGVKLLPTPRVGLRLDGRVFATFVDADGRAVACSPGFCFVAFHADIVWQAELTAGVVVRF
jgi:hypothetical protein